MTILVILLLAIACATVWHFVVRNAERDDALRNAAEREWLASHDAPGVTPSAAQEPAKRKHRKVL